jgi:hypothetical protein
MTMQSADRFGRPAKLHHLWDTFGKGEHDIFPLMRLILPHLDTVRPNYRLKQKQLARMYVDMLALDSSKPDAQVNMPSAPAPSVPMPTSSISRPSPAPLFTSRPPR